MSFEFLFKVLYIQAFVVVMLLGKMMRKVFFGQLRAAEMEVGIAYIVINCMFLEEKSKSVLFHKCFS